MSQRLLSAALIASLGVAALVPGNANAVDGTINITGLVVAQTCKVDGNAYGTSDTKAVALPLVLAPTLATAGSTAGKTPFSLAITGCDAALSNVQTYFSGTNINATTGHLNQTGTATNVDIQLLNSSSAVMPLNGADASAQNSPVVALSGGAATLNYYAQYIATGAATAGNVTSSVQFTMVYQ